MELKNKEIIINYQMILHGGQDANWVLKTIFLANFIHLWYYLYIYLIY